MHYELHNDGPGAWVLTLNANRIGAITRGKNGYRAATMLGRYGSFATLAQAVEFLKTNTQ